MAAHLDESARRRSRPTYERTREHRVVPPAETAEREAWLELDVARPVAASTFDPRLLRVGALAAAAVLIVPVAMALADGGSGAGDEVRSTDVPEAVAAGPADVGDDTEPADTGVPVSAAAVLDPGVLAAEAANEDDDGGAGSSGEKGRPNSSDKGRPNDEPECAGTYAVVEGDYWLRFVDSSGATLDEWLAANDAEPDTQMYVGDELCIPVGAEAPDPPETPTEPVAEDDAELPSTTTAPETTTAETTTTTTAVPVAPTTAATTTTTTVAAAPAATPAPTTTTAPAPPPPVSPTTPTGVEALIREVWPDDIEERALTIARRESSLRPDAYNGWCCYGIFQIYFEANRSFLARHGVTSAQQLLDARTNVTVAYELYKAAGWDPWSQTDPGG